MQLARWPGQLAAREHMHVQMENSLAGARTVVDHDARTALRNAQLPGNVGCGHEQVSEQTFVFRSCVAESRDLPLGDHEKVRRCLRRYVMERQAVFVFVKDLRRDLSSKDASEHVRRIVCQRVLLGAATRAPPLMEQ